MEAVDYDAPFERVSDDKNADFALGVRWPMAGVLFVRQLLRTHYNAPPKSDNEHLSAIR